MLKVRVLAKQYSVDGENPQLWYQGEAFPSALLNVLSLSFPPGEGLFIYALNAFKNKIDDPSLREVVSLFIQQEVNHGKLHVQFNRHHVDPKAAKVINRLYYFRLPLLKKVRRPMTLLAMTVAIEHFTAVVAALVLDSDAFCHRLPKSDRDLWIYHAIEEVEHKNVACDVYRYFNGPYWLLALAMTEALMTFACDLFFLSIYQVFRWRKLGSWQTWKDGYRFLRHDIPILRWSTFRQIMAIYRPSFRPSQICDSHLIKKGESLLEF